VLYKELQFRQIYAKHKVLECDVVGRVEGSEEGGGERDEGEGRAKRG